MDNLENQPSQSSPTPAPNTEDLQAQCASLASLLNSVLILILVLAGAVDLYLFRQVKGVSGELAGTKLYVEQLTRNNQAIDVFVQKLADYGKTHPDFAPIANKYGIKPSTGTTAAPPPGTAAPAPKKK